MWAPMRSLPWQNCKNWTPFCSGEKIFNFFTRDLTIYTRERRVRMAQFFLKIDFLVQHMGTSPQVKMASRYGLHPWLWLLMIPMCVPTKRKVEVCVAISSCDVINLVNPVTGQDRKKIQLEKDSSIDDKLPNAYPLLPLNSSPLPPPPPSPPSPPIPG